MCSPEFQLFYRAISMIDDEARLLTLPLPVLIFGCLSNLWIRLCRTAKALKKCVSIKIKWMACSCNFKLVEKHYCACLALWMLMSSRTSDHVHGVQCKRCCDHLIYFPLCFFWGGYMCSRALLVLLFVVVIQLKKCFASSSGRRGWSACGQLRRAELGCLLPSPLVCAGAVRDS